MFLLAWVIVHWRRGDRRNALLALGLALPALVMTLVVENHWTSGAPGGEGSRRLVHWNVASGLHRPAVVELLCAQHADVYVLSEAYDPEAVEALRARLGKRYEARSFGSLAILATGPIRDSASLIRRDGARVQKVIWEDGQREVTLLLVDLPSKIRIPRDPWLREVGALIERHQPDLVVGDFNAPRRSLGLATLPAGYRHAYDSVGSGWGYTWPVPVPVYSLDHCLHSAEIVPVLYELRSSFRSDHRLQVFDFGWRR